MNNRAGPARSQIVGEPDRGVLGGKLEGERSGRGEFVF